MFRFLFQAKEGIYTNNAPPSRHMSCTEKRQISKLDIGDISENWLNVQKKDKMFNLVIHGILVFYIYQTAKIGAYHSSFLLVI